MPQHILVVNDCCIVPPELRLDPCWQQISWQMFFAREVSAALTILLAPPDADRTLELLRQTESRRVRGRILWILDRDTPPATLDLAFAVADDVILYPEREDVIRQRIRRLADPETAELDSARENLIAELSRLNLIGRDHAFLCVADRIPTCARSDFPVLITGETGTGKELFARAVHFLSRRRNQPFIPVDCGGIPDYLFENEMFGHMRGAYTDAHREQKGLAAMAEGGTLFLDEIDSLSAGAQSKLLRFLQERQYKPLGAERYERSDIKLLAATNGCLEELVEEKRFRQDLYFRLNVLRLDLPALRERARDITLLAEHFLSLYSAPGEARSFTAAALRQLQDHSWPGNVRELLNAVQRAIAFARGRSIDACDVAPRTQPAPATAFRKAREEVLQDFERKYVEEMLARHHGNVTRAASEAGKERRAFGKLVKKYGLSGRAAVGRS